MTRLRLIARSLFHHRRRHLAVVLCTAIATAAITGSLLVGGSVEGSLQALERLRTGRIGLALRTPDRTFRGALADEIAADVATTVAPALELPALAGLADKDDALPGVRLIGVDDRFFALGEHPISAPEDERIILSAALAETLQAKVGDELVIRAERPSPIPTDLPLAIDADLRVSVTVDRIAADQEMGRFDLRAEADAPLLAFVRWSWLAEKAGLPHRANMLLVGEGSSPEAVQRSLRSHFELADAEAALRPAMTGGLELWSNRIFLDEPLAKAAQTAGGRPVLAWFVQSIRAGSMSVPYSMVAGIQAGPHETEPTLQAIGALAPGQVIINDWLAEQLHVHVGDGIDLDYDVFGLARQMERKSAHFTVGAVVPMAGWAADPALMPFVPGLSDVANCRDWSPGFAVDTGQMRPQDEQYWNAHRGTPKVFLSIEDAERLFSSRYGTRTAFRFDSPAPELAAKLAGGVDPATLGLTFAPVHRLPTATDFGPLFGGFSFVLVVSALLMTSLLFSFGIEERAEEVGTLRALGFRSKDIHALLLGEASILALMGAALGVPAGLAYTRLLLTGLSTVWREAAGLPTLSLHVTREALILGGVFGMLASLAGLFFVLRGQLRVEARALLAGPPPMRPSRGRSRPIAISLAVIAVLLLLVFGRRTGPQAAEVFFGAGALLLLGGLFGADAFLVAVARSKAQARTFSSLALSSAARRRGRSLTTIALIAAGAFLVVGVGGGRSDPRFGAEQRSSGTGGFTLVAESTRPIARDLNAPAVRPLVGLDPNLPASFVSFRVHEGDDASCRSPGLPATPRLYGVDPAALADRKAFMFETQASWSDLQGALYRDGAVPVIGDEGTVIWSLHRNVGDTLDLTDALGQPLQLRIVGITTTSILQGGLVMAEDEFVRHFPGEGGYRFFLVDSATSEASTVASALTTALRDEGIRVQPAWRRLASFQSVENTYLAIFQTLGALGLLFGCLGIAVLVLRHALERRAELAVLEAVGFTRTQVRLLFVTEHSTLVVVGLVNGAASALVCLIPMLRSGAPVPVAGIVIDLFLITAVAVASTFGATWLALRGPIARALQVDS